MLSPNRSTNSATKCFSQFVNLAISPPLSEIFPIKDENHNILSFLYVSVKFKLNRTHNSREISVLKDAGQAKFRLMNLFMLLVFTATLNKKFRYKSDGMSRISHFSDAKCKFALLQSWHIAVPSVFQTKHASKSHETKIYHWQKYEK